MESAVSFSVCEVSLRGPPLVSQALVSLRHPPYGLRDGQSTRAAGPGGARRGGRRWFARRSRRAGRLRGRELEPARRGFPRCRKVRKKRPAVVFNRANGASERDAARTSRGEARGAARRRGAAAGRHAVTRPVTNPFYTAGWVRSCLQDESGRTNRACDWPARTCNASGSRADCAVSRRLPGQSRACLFASDAREDRSETRWTRFSPKGDRFPSPLLLFPSTTTVFPIPFLPRQRARRVFPLPPRARDRFSLNSCFLEPPTRSLSFFFFFPSPHLPNCLTRATLFFFPRSRLVAFFFVYSALFFALSYVSLSRHRFRPMTIGTSLTL